MYVFILSHCFGIFVKRKELAFSNLNMFVFETILFMGFLTALFSIHELII
jgi:hypothetical protein